MEAVIGSVADTCCGLTDQVTNNFRLEISCPTTQKLKTRKTLGFVEPSQFQKHLK